MTFIFHNVDLIYFFFFFYLLIIFFFYITDTMKKLAGVKSKLQAVTSNIGADHGNEESLTENGTKLKAYARVKKKQRK